MQLVGLPTQIDCPRCAAPMGHLVLSTHGVRPVTVDHCSDCRLVWFDALESVQLDGLGWITLLRELQSGAAGSAGADGAVPLSCPTCRSTLKVVHNRTRFGRMTVLECPQRHGHLHSHAGVLAERGLVRPLLAPERAALATERHALHCLNCGAPSDGRDEHCRYCGTPLLVVDMPRLAHALRLRLHGQGPSPAPSGPLVAWACRGCGEALDPTRQPHCPRCGHMVVAPRLLDLAPLLDAAERELRAAADAAAAQRRPRRPPRRRTWRETGVALAAQWLRSDDAGTPGQRLQGALALVVMLLLTLWWLWRF